MLIGKGIVAWGPGERHTNRYGVVLLRGTTYHTDVTYPEELDVMVLGAMKGRVRLTCKVLEARESGHCGDFDLGIQPTTPSVGEELEIGVGRIDWNPALPGILLRPDDGREDFWIDPRILYRLHDQTIELYAEETEDPCHADPSYLLRAPVPCPGL
jgi:hypothetical protein